MSAQEASSVRDEGAPERVPFESPPPLESPPHREAGSTDVDLALPLIVFSIVIAVYAGIGCGLYLLLGALF